MAEENLVGEALAKPAPGTVQDQPLVEPGQTVDRARPAEGVTRSFLDAAATTGEGSALADAAPPPVATGRYLLGAEIARGGMGAVYRAADTILDREVAVKVLQEKYGPDSGPARRFADEARITGRLQHPAIPPVHDLGTLPDGRPFLAMKLIQGQTLAAMLVARPDPASDRGRFVAVFEQICQAMAYAHAHGVIHRDLKPANVMVGSFGEVQVMDWGLAKVLGTEPVSPTPARAREVEPASADPDSTTDHRPAAGSTEDRTQAGQVLGTPAYMPPEQARGEVDRVDRRSDVFALGGILCAVLTGSAPFATRDAHRKAAAGELSDAFGRLDGCGADAELVELCRRCLAAEPMARPAGAGEVAKLVAEYRAGVEQRLRTAERERAAAEAKAVELKKRRRVQLALAAAVAVVLLGGGAFGWYGDRQATAERGRLSRNSEAVGTLLDECEHALRAGNAVKADEDLASAKKRAAEGGADDLAGRWDRLGADLAVLRALDRVDQFRWTPAGSKFPDAAAVATHWRAALDGFEADPDVAVPEAAAARVAASAIRDRLVEALDRVLGAEKSGRVCAALRACDADPFRDAVRDAVAAGDGPTVVALAGRPEVLAQPPGFVAVLGEEAAIPVERRRELLGAAVGRRPGNTALLMALGMTYPINQRDGADERLRWFQTAVGLGPANPAFRLALGNALYDKGDLNAAIAEYKEALGLDPTYAEAHNNLGNALRTKGDLDGAIAEAREALRLDPNSAPAHYGLGLAGRAKGDLDGAITEFKEAIRLDPKSALPHNGLGNTLGIKGDLDGAITEFKEAIRLDPKDALPHNGLANALYGKGNPEGAIAEYKEAIRLDPAYTAARNNLGNALKDKGDLEGAIAQYKEALRLDPKYAQVHNGLGLALQIKGDLEGAIAEFKEALRLDPKQRYAVVNLPRAERMRALLPRLPGVLADSDRPANPAEAVEFANLCAALSKTIRSRGRPVRQGIRRRPETDRRPPLQCRLLRRTGRHR